MGNQVLNPYPGFPNKVVSRINRQFKALDKDNNDYLDCQEIFGNSEIRQNPLIQRVFSIMDSNKDGKLSFQQFLYGVNEVCNTSKENKLLFAFKIYDLDGDGFISEDELFQSVKIMVGTNLTNQQLQQLVDRTMNKIDLDCDGKISFQEFKLGVEHLDMSGRSKLWKNI